MARKGKKHHKKPVRRHSRGRIGAAGHHMDLMGIAETAIGLVGGNMLGVMMQKHLTQIPQKLLSIGQIGLGLMNVNRPQKILAGAAWGLAGAGATGLAHETGILRGIDEVVSGMLNHGMNDEHEEEMHFDHNQGMSGMLNDQTLSGMSNSTTLGDAPEAGLADQFYAPVLGYN